MTFIELFDKNPPENICACLVSTPDRVILIGDNIKTLCTHKKRYEDFFLKRGKEIEFIPKAVNKNSLVKIVDLLCEIVETYDDCVFDLTGGDELMLVAVGIVFHQYRDMNIQMHRFNLRTNKIYDCDNDGTVIDIENIPELTVEEYISLFGGKVSYENDSKIGTHLWDFTDAFRDDIDAMWEICRHNPREWNTQIAVFKAAQGLRVHDDNPYKTIAPIDKLTSLLMSTGYNYIYNSRIINSLIYYGLITFDNSDKDTLSITYKNEQVRECLTKEGLILELEVTLAAMEAKDKHGDYVYTDVLNGVHIDWDGEIHESDDIYDIENEVDVIMTHNMVPVFVSCKNGKVEIDELYKLDTVATKFGGKYARKVLVATALGKESTFSLHLSQRAKDMGIRIVDNLQDMNPTELQKCIRSLWSNH
ncbi:MAG: DUF1887 family protein [Ruminococcus sp.]|nr:DUF1887 family protein [Ruminococcus sp.]